MENDELTKNVTGWLHTLLEQGGFPIDANQADYVVTAKKWLKEVNNGELVVISPSDP